MDDMSNLALFRRYLWKQHNITWIYTSEVSKLKQSREAYYASFGMQPQKLAPDVQKEMDDLLISAALAAESQPDRDLWGWTIRIPLKTWGFFCGSDPEGTVCGHFTELEAAAAKDPVGAFAVQRMTEDLPIRQTSLIPRDTSAKYFVEQYFDESEQLPARIAITDTEALMALSMPDADWDLVEKLTETELLAMFHALIQENEPESADLSDDLMHDARSKMKAKFAAFKSQEGHYHGDLKVMHEAVFYYGCRCSAEKIREMIALLPRGCQKDIWGDLTRLDIECPRCGRMFTVDK